MKKSTFRKPKSSFASRGDGGGSDKRLLRGVGVEICQVWRRVRVAFASRELNGREINI